MLQLIKDKSGDIQKLLKCFIGTLKSTSNQLLSVGVLVVIFV